jgi:hypothetical protein
MLESSSQDECNLMKGGSGSLEADAQAYQRMSVQKSRKLRLPVCALRKNKRAVPVNSSSVAICGSNAESEIPP